MATMTPTNVSVTLTNTSGTCWSQSGSTKKYESSLGPTSSDTTYMTIEGISSDSSICNYSMVYSLQAISTNQPTYTLPSGYTADSSGSLTYTWTLPSKTVYSIYGGVKKATTWGCTLIYRYKQDYEYTYNISFTVWQNGGGNTYSGNIGPCYIMVRSTTNYKVIYGETSILFSGGGSQNTQIKSSESSITFEFMATTPSDSNFTWMDPNHTSGTYKCDSTTKSVSISISMRYTYSSGGSSTTTVTKPTVELYAYNTSQSYAYIRVNWGTSNQASTCTVKVYSSGGSTSGLVRDTVTCSRSGSAQYQYYKTNNILNSQIGNYTCSVYSYS